MRIAWFFLLTAIATEVVGTLSMKQSGQTGDFWNYSVMWLCIAASYTFLSFALRKIAVGIAVAIWEGLGTALITGISILFLEESMTTQKVLGLSLALLGVVLLHFGESAERPAIAESEVDLEEAK